MKVIYKTYLKYLFLFILLCGSFTVSASIISGTIDQTNRNAQVCENILCSITSTSPVNFGFFTDPPTTNASSYIVHVTDTQLTGFIWGKSFGWVVLNCLDTTSGCASNPQLRVANDNNGHLSGYAWGQTSGWINFGPFLNSVTSPISINSSGEFNGYAWSQNHGWIKFDCSDSNYCVKTDWRPRNTRPQCSDGIDNDTDSAIDSNDSGCHTDGNSSNSGSYDPTDNSEVTGGPGGCTVNCDPPTFCELNPSDPSCLPPPFCSTHPTDPSCLAFCVTHPNDSSCRNPHDGGGGVHICSNNFDDDGDGLVDLDDPGCANDPNGDSENPPTFCSLHPNDAICNPPNNFCAIHPTDPSCVGSTPIKTPIDKISGLNGKEIAKIAVPIIVATGALSGVLLSFLTSIFASPLTFSEIFLIPLRLWSLFLAALGIKKRNRPWGTVYDSVTKQPLDPAYVMLTDLQGKEVSTSITDISGRYGFLVPPGQYRMIANKTNYTFPSKKLQTQISDEVYQDLYFGDIIDIAEGQVITKNIPMDAINFDWNEFAKRKQDLVKFYSRRDIWITRISNILFALGFAVTTVAVLVSPKIYNIITFAVYVLIFILKHTILKPRPFGTLVYKGTSVPLAFAIVRVYTVGSDREVIKKVSDRTGKYYCLVPNGAYYVKIEVKNNDGSYSSAYTSTPFEVKDGFLRKKFEI